MDPNTGKFYDVDEYEKEHGKPVPAGWPVFEEGEVVKLKGFDFTIARINKSSLTLRPVLSGLDVSARQLMGKIGNSA